MVNFESISHSPLHQEGLGRAEGLKTELCSGPRETWMHLYVSAYKKVMYSFFVFIL
jgi:hypothetical protein